MNIEKYYTQANALLKGHFLLSSGNHSDRIYNPPKSLRIQKSHKNLPLP